MNTSIIFSIYEAKFHQLTYMLEALRSYSHAVDGI